MIQEFIDIYIIKQDINTKEENHLDISLQKMIFILCVFVLFSEKMIFILVLSKKCSFFK